MREHVDDAGGLQRIALLLDEGRRIPRQRPGIAGHVNDSPGTGSLDVFRNGRCPAARRVQQYLVPACGKPGFTAIESGEIGAAKLCVPDAVQACVGRGPLDLVCLTVDAENVFCLACERQRKIADSAE